MKPIIVFGSNILDMFFDVPDFAFFTSRGEDALHFKTHQQEPGGKGANQAVAAAKAGAKVRFYGALGDGSHARFILNNFKSVGIDTRGILQMKEHPTGFAAIMNNAEGKHKIIVSHGANLHAKASQIPDSALGPKAILLLQAEMDPRENHALMARAKKSGSTIILNVAPAKPIPRKTLELVDYLIVNEPEARELAKGLGIEGRDLTQFARAMAKSLDLMCIVTMGEKGSVAITANMAQPIHTPALKINVKDTVGAGDAFAGAFAAALSKDLPAAAALRHAAVAGSLACRQVGAQASLPTEAEIKRALPKLKTMAPTRPQRQVAASARR